VKLKHLFTINAVISTFFGLSLLFIPIRLFELYGQQLNEFEATTARMWGTAIVGFALITWFFRNLPDSEARRKIVLAMSLYMTVGFVSNVYNQLTVPQPQIDWSTPVLYLFLAIGYGYFHFKTFQSRN
jgi:hypothetical protein